MIAIPKHIQKGIERWQKEPGKTKRSQYIHPFDRCKDHEITSLHTWIPRLVCVASRTKKRHLYGEGMVDSGWNRLQLLSTVWEGSKRHITYPFRVGW